MLSRKDFRALLDKRPAVRAEIEAVAARRIAETRGQGGVLGPLSWRRDNAQVGC